MPNILLNDTIQTNSTLSIMKFAILLSLEIPSTVASIISCIYIIRTPSFRRKEHNMSISILMITNFVQIMFDVPMVVHFFRIGEIVQPRTSSFCYWWIWFEFSLNGININLMTWISIERHLIIFHQNVLRTVPNRKKKFLRFVPLVICLFYDPMFTFIVAVLSPMCKNRWNYQSLLCGLPCYLLTNVGIFDLIINIIIPVLIILTANVILMVRVLIYQMFGINRQQINWYRQRKMILQLFLFSSLYLSVWLPLSFVQLGQVFFGPTFLSFLNDTVNFLIYVVPLILPFFCLLAKPIIIKTWRNVLFEKTRIGVGVRTLN